MIVYKYYSPKDYNIETLQNHYFWFSKVSKLNDPFDASSKLLQSPCFVENLLKSCNLNLEQLERLMGEYGTCSFSKIRDNKVLWASYADNYSGFVVAFDDEDFVRFFEKYKIRFPYQEVKYVDSVPDFDDLNGIFNIRILGENHIETVKFWDCFNDKRNQDKLFTFICSIKSAIWLHEQEFRLICAYDVIGNKDRLEKSGIIYNENGYKIPYESTFIKSIIVGHNASTKTIQELLCIAKSLNIELIITKPSEKPFNICFKRH